MKLRLLTMNKVSSLIQEFFPEEKIQEEYKGILRDSWAGKVGKFPVGKSKYFYLKPMDIVETKECFYFDRRQPFAYQSKVSFFTTPIFLVVAFMLISRFFWNLSSPILLFVIVFGIGILIALLDLKINQGLVNIVVLKKNWITDDKTKGEWRVLEGKTPEGEGYSFIHRISEERRVKVSLLDKLFGGVFIYRLIKKIPTSAQFTFRIKKVEK